MGGNLPPSRDWAALEQSVAWLPWHRSAIALSLLHQPSIGTNLAKECVHWLHSDGNLLEPNYSLNCSPLGIRLLVSLESTSYANDFSFEIQRAREIAGPEIGKHRQRARSFLAAIDMGQLSPSRALWWLGNLIRQSEIPENLRKKKAENFDKFSNAFEKLRVSIRMREPAGIVESMAVWLSLSEEKRVLWPRLCKSIESEALDRLFAWPLVVTDETKHKTAVAVPVFVDAKTAPIKGLGNWEIIDGRVLMAAQPVKTPVRTEDDEKGKDSWRLFASEWAKYARTLLLNHNRHLGDEAVRHIESANLSIDLGASDSVLGHLFGSDAPIRATGRSASALFATAFAAAIMNRELPKIAIIGDLIAPADGPIDRRRGPQVGAVDIDGIIAKIGHVYLSEGYDALIVPRMQDFKESDGLPESEHADEEAPTSLEVAVKAIRVPTFRSSVLSNVWDVAFPNTWRRYRWVRCPDALLPCALENVLKSRIQDWFKGADVVDYLPDWITIRELGAYLRWCAGEIASLNPAPPGISQFFMRFEGSDGGTHAVLGLAEALYYPRDHLSGIESEDLDVLKRVLTDMLRPGGHYPGAPLGQAPDLMTFVFEPPEVTSDLEGSIAQLDLASILKSVRSELCDTGRRPEWRDYVGQSRIILVEGDRAPASQLRSPEFDEALTELSVFRRGFAKQQASAVVTSDEWRGARINLLLNELEKQGSAVYVSSIDSWLVTQKAALPKNLGEVARLHELAGRSFATSLLGLNSSGLPFMRSFRREVIAEAVYHLNKAAKYYLQVQRRDGYSRCRQLAADLIAAFYPASWRTIRVAAQLRLLPLEPFIAMGSDLLNGEAGQPSDLSGRDLVRLIAGRLDELVGDRRRSGRYEMNADSERLSATACQLIANVCNSLGENRPMEGTISEILEHPRIRQLVADKEQLRKFRDTIKKVINGPSFDLSSIRPDVLHETISEMYQEDSARSERLRLYEQAFISGHLSYADLYLAMLGAAATHEEAEMLMAKYVPRLDRKLIDYILDYKWRNAKSNLLPEMRRGFTRFEMHYPS